MTTAPECPRMLGHLVCTNTTPHEGDGRGCVHDAGSGVRDKHYATSGGEG